MLDDERGVDLSIQLLPVDDRSPRRRSKRRFRFYALIAGACLLSFATIFAAIAKLAEIVRAKNAPVSVSFSRDAAADRAEAIRVLSSFDASEERQTKHSREQQSERDAIAALFRNLSDSVANDKVDEFRESVDFDRLAMRINLFTSGRRLTSLEKRMLRGELKSTLQSESTWARLLVAGIVTPRDDPDTRIVYAYGADAGGAEQTAYRFWLGRVDNAWKLYDWNRLDVGMSESLWWGLHVKYQGTALIAGFSRSVEQMNEAAELTASGDYGAAKEKLRLAELQRTPPELADYLWLYFGHRWAALGERAEAERCYLKVSRPEQSPGAYLGLMSCKRWSNPREALKYAELYENCAGPSIDSLVVKAQVSERLGRDGDAAAEWKKVLRIEPENSQALAQFFLLLPRGDKSAFEQHLVKFDQPAAALENIAGQVGYRDYPGLLWLVALLQRRSPRDAGTLYMAGLAKHLDGQYADAAEQFRAAASSANDDGKRQIYEARYVDAMVANGQAIAAWNTVTDPKSAFESLFYNREEGEFALADDEYRQLVGLFRGRYPNDWQGMQREIEWNSEQEMYDDVEHLARKALATTVGAAAKKAEGDDDEREMYRNSFADSLATALYKLGRLREAYEIEGSRDERFLQLANLAIADRDWDAVQSLLALHPTTDPPNAQICAIEAELAVHEKRWDDAVLHIQRGLKAASEADQRPLKSRLREVYVESGRWRQFYEADASESDAFESLADGFVEDENWDALKELMTLHRRRSPRDVRLAKYDAELAWAHDDYVTYATLAPDLLQAKNREALGDFSRIRGEDRLLSALIRTRQFSRAREVAQAALTGDIDIAKLAVVHAAEGNVPEALRLARQSAVVDGTTWRMYSHADAGPIFLGEPFREFQREFPVAFPYNVTPTLAVFCFDQPWKLELADISAALGQLGQNQVIIPRPLETLEKDVRSFSIQVGEASIWLAGGEGEFDKRWRVRGAEPSLATAVKENRAWLAVGTAGFGESHRKPVEALARRLASRLAGDRATALCHAGRERWDGFTAYEVKPGLIDAWQSSGQLGAFHNDGYTLQVRHFDKDVASHREFDRSLGSAVRTFEAIPGTKLEVIGSLCERPAFDLMRLEVEVVRRNFGGFSFDGTLKSAPQSMGEFKVGLPMRLPKWGVLAWRLNEGELVFRPQ
jgi:hypothetical protein